MSTTFVRLLTFLLSCCLFATVTPTKLNNLTSFICLENPKKLILFGKNIQRIEPGALYNCRSVEKIYLYENELRDLSRETFVSNMELTELSLSYNNLRFLDPDLFVSLEKLEILDLLCNEIVYFPSELVRNCGNLKEVQLASNRLLDLDIGQLLIYMPKLVWFYFSVNSIGCTRADEIAKMVLSRRVKVGVYFCPENQRPEHIEKAINSTVRIQCIPDGVAQEEAKGVQPMIEEWKKNRMITSERKLKKPEVVESETIEPVETTTMEFEPALPVVNHGMSLELETLQEEFRNFTSKMSRRLEFLFDQIIEIKQALKDGNKSIQVTVKSCDGHNSSRDIIEMDSTSPE